MEHNEPAFLHDPELYAARFFGMMRAPMNRMNMADDCEVQSSECTMEPDVTCSDCYKTCCLHCSFQTGVADSYRCADCERENLDKLQRACRMIGQEQYVDRLAAALVNEFSMEVCR